MNRTMDTSYHCGCDQWHYPLGRALLANGGDSGATLNFRSLRVTHHGGAWSIEDAAFSDELRPTIEGNVNVTERRKTN